MFDKEIQIEILLKQCHTKLTISKSKKTDSLRLILFGSKKKTTINPKSEVAPSEENQRSSPLFDSFEGFKYNIERNEEFQYFKSSVMV